MIVTETLDGNLIKTYSDLGMKVKNKITNEMFDEAIDPIDKHREYDETNIPIDQHLQEDAFEPTF